MSKNFAERFEHGLVRLVLLSLGVLILVQAAMMFGEVRHFLSSTDRLEGEPLVVQPGEPDRYPQFRSFWRIFGSE